MKMTVISNYGAEEKVFLEKASATLVAAAICTLDWNGFHQVVLEQPNGDYLEVGGSLNPEDGFSAMYQQGDEQFVTDEPPSTVDELLQMQTSYISGTDAWKSGYEWV